MEQFSSRVNEKTKYFTHRELHILIRHCVRNSGSRKIYAPIYQIEESKARGKDYSGN